MCIHIHIGSDASSVDTGNYSLNVGLPDLSAIQVVDALSEWDGMENTVALFKDLMISESSELLSSVHKVPPLSPYHHILLLMHSSRTR